MERIKKKKIVNSEKQRSESRPATCTHTGSMSHTGETPLLLKSSISIKVNSEQLGAALPPISYKVQH